MQYIRQRLNSTTTRKLSTQVGTTEKLTFFLWQWKGKWSYFRRILAASWHSETRRLYPESAVKACFKPENASNILYAFCNSIASFFRHLGGCTSLCSLVYTRKLHLSISKTSKNVLCDLALLDNQSSLAIPLDTTLLTNKAKFVIFEGIVFSPLTKHRD